MGVLSYGYKGVVAGAKALKNVFKGGAQKTTGTEVIKSFKPGTEFKGTPKYQKEIITAKSEIQKKFNPINEGIANETKKLKQKLQGMRGERITQSGISKGKDLVKKAKGGRVGLKAGTNPFKKKSSTEKIKKTFSRDLGMQSVIYGLDKNKNVTKADPKAKFIAAANKKKKKKII